MVDIIVKKYKLMIDKIILLYEQSTDINLIYQLINQNFDLSIDEFMEIYNNLFVNINT